MSKMQNLQEALRQSTGKPVPSTALPPGSVPAASAPSIVSARAPGRAEQVNISAWLHADYKSSLRLVQARKGRNATLQGLMSEALNDLFTKYDVPTIRE